MKKEIKLKNAVFVQAFNKLKEEGFYDNFAKTLNLKPKTACSKNTVKNHSSTNDEKKTNMSAAAGNIRLSASK